MYAHTFQPGLHISPPFPCFSSQFQDYNAGFSIENVVPAYAANVQDEFDLALAAIIALLIVLFVGAVSFIVLCCCLKHW